jgi:hypothetical protein
LSRRGGEAGVFGLLSTFRGFPPSLPQNPNYYPPQPPNLHELYPNPWYLINRNFDKLARDLIALTKVRRAVRGVRRVRHMARGVIAWVRASVIACASLVRCVRAGLRYMNRDRRE